jgi:hypothetical protein
MLDDPHYPTKTGKPEAPMQSLNRNSGGPLRGKAQSPHQKTSLIEEGWLSLLRWLPPPKLSKVLSLLRWLPSPKLSKVE